MVRIISIQKRLKLTRYGNNTPLYQDGFFSLNFQTHFSRTETLVSRLKLENIL